MVKKVSVVLEEKIGGCLGGDRGESGFRGLFVVELWVFRRLELEGKIFYG